MSGGWEARQEDKGRDGECREVQTPYSWGENLDQRTMRVRPICTCHRHVTLLGVLGLHHPYIAVSLQQRQPGSGRAACLGLQRAL